MEAVIDKKPPRMTSRWGSRCFRLKNRQFMYFPKDKTEKDFLKLIDNQAKLTLDLTHLIGISIDSKRPIITLRHPKSDLLLKFANYNQFIGWVKALSAYGNRPGKKVDAEIPSNFSFAIWKVLQQLYDNEKTLKTEGVFRISGSKKERNALFNRLLIDGMYFLCLTH